MLKSDIYQYNYNPKAIRKMIRPNDFWFYKDKINKDNVDNITKEISEEFAKKNRVKKLKKQTLYDNPLFLPDTLYDSLTIRRTNSILKDTLKITLQSRERIISQILNVIDSEKNNNCYIFRTDIKQFYESINFKEIISNLQNRNLATHTVINHLENIHKKVKGFGYPGLPRGLSISSTLSEYCMKDFDREVWNIPGVIFYSRYVDDIVIIMCEDRNPKSDVEKKLYDGLELNDSKTFYYGIGDENYIEYLGYSINLKNILQTRVSRKKLDRIKKRIILSIKSFNQDSSNDFTLLLDRLRFLSGNSELKISGRKKKMVVGFRYQYSECSNDILEEQLKSLDTFYKGILFSKKYKVTKNLQTKIDNNQLTELHQISFVSGFNNNITHFFGRKRVSKIKDAWRYE